jgi:hypothetical protein
MNLQNFEKDYNLSDIVDENDDDGFLNVDDYIGKDLGNICIHPYIYTENNVQKCQDCAMELSVNLSLEPEWRYYADNDNRSYGDPTRAHARKNEEKTIFRDLQKFDFPVEICSKANEYYNLSTKGTIRRANCRLAIICACVFLAYKQQCNPQTPDYLQNKFGLTKKEVSKGLNFINLRMEKTIKPIYIDPEVFVENIMKKFNSSPKHIIEVNKLYKRVVNRSSSLNRGNPQSVVSGLIFYYFRMLKNNISYSKFSEIVGLSIVIIEKNSKIISEILGTTDIVNLGKN